MGLGRVEVEEGFWMAPLAFTGENEGEQAEVEEGEEVVDEVELMLEVRCLRRWPPWESWW